VKAQETLLTIAHTLMDPKLIRETYTYNEAIPYLVSKLNT